MATIVELQALQDLIVKSLNNRITQDIADDIPTDAATLGVAIKLLKDNNVSADPADSQELSGLREKLAEQQRQRANRRNNVINMADHDLKLQQGG